MSPGAPEPPGARSARGRAVGCGVACTVLWALAVALLPAALAHARARADRTRCADQLRRLGLAAVQYADARRFFPHVARIRDLDGDIETPDTPRKVRALHWLGDHEDPRGWVCPASDDGAEPRDTPGRLDPRAWRWRGATSAAPGDVGPIAAGDDDPTLLETHELSYGWTRKGMSSSARSVELLAADRAHRGDPAAQRGLAGNHEAGTNVACVDASVHWLPSDVPEVGRLHLADEGGKLLLHTAPSGATQLSGEGGAHLTVLPPGPIARDRAAAPPWLQTPGGTDASRLRALQGAAAAIPTAAGWLLLGALLLGRGRPGRAPAGAAEASDPP